VPPVQSYTEKRPPRALATIVSTVWIQHVGAGSEPYLQRNVPNGSAEILCRLGETPRVVGPRTVPSIDVLAPGTTVVGARLRPGAAGAVFEMPASELVDRTVDAAELWGSASETLWADLAGAGQDDAVVQILEGALLARCAGAPAVDPIVAETVRRLERNGDSGLGAIRSGLHLSERHFRRRIGDAVGLSPKALQRMLRFQRFLASTQFSLFRGDSSAAAGLATLAAASGYADESHLNRECRRLTGLTVGRFLAETDRDCGCGHDHRASFTRILGDT
jgi:AraC-like DNA-binding protein